MSDSEIKVTDKRMFTPDGRLREEFQFLEERLEGKGKPAADAAGSAPDTAGQVSPDPTLFDPASTPGAAPPSGTPAGSEALGRSEGGRSEGGRSEGGRSEGGRGEGPALELPELGPDTGRSPQFLDLVAMLAEPASVYMGDVEMPGAGPVEDLQMARLHIDLLGVLRQRTAGNLSAQESAFLDNVLYQLRSRYIQKRG